MKKVLLIGGLGIAGFGLYRYFKFQINQALQYDYKIKNFQIESYDKDNINVAIELEITNKSSFEILVREYDLQLFFRGKNFATAKNTTPFAVMPNSSFTLKTTGTINIEETKVSIFPFLQDVLKKKPINIEVSGYIMVKFLGLPYTMKFNNNQFQYSTDLLTELGLSNKVDAFAKKNPFIGKLLGIK